ncbi:hypothetical protein N9V48_01010 [Planktomarina temperata]|nr:hypothetical protein [Planktomarina temperata]
MAYAETQGSELAVLFCDGTARHCESNVEGYRFKCELCKYRVKKLSRFGAKKVPFSAKKHRWQSTNEIIEKKLHNSAKGIIASLEASSDYESFSIKGKNLVGKLTASAMNLYEFLCQKIELDVEFTKYTTFNGRYPFALATYLATKDKVQFSAMEIWGQKVPHLSSNKLIHDPTHVFESCKKSYDQIGPEKATIVSEEYYKARFMWGGGKSGEINFVEGQVQSDNLLFEHKKDYIKISVYPSSNFEYNFLPEGYVPLNQALELERFINALVAKNFKSEIHLRLHPNLRRAPSSEYKQFLELLNLQSNDVRLKVHEPHDKTSTYQLMKESDFVVSFASFSAVEANYLGKKVLQIGPSRYRLFNISNIYHTGYDAAKAVFENAVSSHSNVGSQIFSAGFICPNNEYNELAQKYNSVKEGRLERLFSKLIIALTRYKV